MTSGDENKAAPDAPEAEQDLAAAEPIPPIIPTGLDAVIAFVRHGESQWVAEGRFQGQGDSPLSDLGQRQALLTARRIARRNRKPTLPLPAGAPLQIVHSPLLRAAETATVIGRAVSGGRGEDAIVAPVALRPEDGLLEIGQGEWEGLPSTEVTERWGDVLTAWRQDPLTAWAPGGESIADVDVRVRVALRQLLADLADVAAEPRGTRSQVLGYGEVPADEPWSIVVGHDGVFKVAMLALLDYPLSRFWTLPFALCGITVVEIRDGRPRLRLHNATDHLTSIETEAERVAAEARRKSGAL
ncbi:MAG TPA: histidine phosphatase family protein [Candidatus Limnocylindria bacterium]|nr:histidine phosphatase family protein [Candidatus Limnocylindria bacterium]